MSATAPEGRETGPQSAQQSAPMPLRALDLFSGCGGLGLGFLSAGFHIADHLEIDAAASAAHARNFGDDPATHDITAEDPEAWHERTGDVDVILGGPPCFTAGHVVLTERGYVPIEDVRVGDRVVTHTGTLQPVLRTGHAVKEVGTLQCTGQNRITCTADHPFLTYDRTNAPARWTRALLSAGRWWVSLTHYDIPAPQGPLAEGLSDEDALLLAGIYVGAQQANPAAAVTFKPHKSIAGHLSEHVTLQKTEERVYRTASFHVPALEPLLRTHFTRLDAQGAHTCMPAWMLCHPQRNAFLRGMIGATGRFQANKMGFQVAHQSLSLTATLRDLAQSLGMVATLGRLKDKHCVTARPHQEGGHGNLQGSHIIRRIGRFAARGEQTVYNIEVAEDHSYVVQGMVVHNCQAFSKVGRSKLRHLHGENAHIHDPRTRLAEHYLDFVQAYRPRAVVMENVPDIITHAGGNVAEQVARVLGESGYVARYAVLNAAQYGVPQFRERMILIGLREDLGLVPSFPQATHGGVMPAGYIYTRQPVLLHAPAHQISVSSVPEPLPYVTPGEALRDLPAQAYEGKAPWPEVEYVHPCAPGSYPHLMRHWPGFETAQTVTAMVARTYPRDTETFRMMPPGGDYVDAYAAATQRFEAHLRTLPSRPAEDSPAYAALRRQFIPPHDVTTFRNRWQRLHPNRPARTLLAHLGKDGYSHIHHEHPRPITMREAARLQSFPDGFLFPDGMNHAGRMIGNAVPPLLAQAIARHLKGMLAPPP